MGICEILLLVLKVSHVNRIHIRSEPEQLAHAEGFSSTRLRVIYQTRLTNTH